MSLGDLTEFLGVASASLGAPRDGHLSVICIHVLTPHQSRPAFDEITSNFRECWSVLSCGAEIAGL